VSFLREDWKKKTQAIKKTQGKREGVPFLGEKGTSLVKKEQA
jgi:hypothetical protein